MSKTTHLVGYLFCLATCAAMVAAENNPVVVIETTFGDIEAELFPERSPLAVENFLQYVEDGFYEGTIFHRVRKGVLVQGGGFTPALQQKKPREPIRNEANNRVNNERWTLAAARSGGIHTTTAQFFINTADNRQFDHKGMTLNKFGYTVFGRVIQGSEVITAIESIKTTNRGGMRDVPSVPIVIKAVRLVESDEPSQ